VDSRRHLLPVAACLRDRLPVLLTSWMHTIGTTCGNLLGPYTGGGGTEKAATSSTHYSTVQSARSAAVQTGTSRSSLFFASCKRARCGS
jgi:hypothetical protein